MSATAKEPPVRGKKPVGAALVVGGGVGGMQAALDLAEAGIKVYLADKQPCIGGTMAQLDKTFPTNDCSMCIVAPRLVDVGRHLNIEVLTGTELESVRGEAGNFEVTLRRDGRFIDLAKCTGCGACADVCPVQLNAEFDMGLAQRKAIYKRYPQAVPGAYAIDKQGSPACSLACPAGVNACGYITLIAKGKFKEALELERQNNPLPAICGRVCPHPCERDCRRGTLDQPLAIAHLKRFLADWELTQPYEPPPKPALERIEKVAVVGAGPGGLTCAVELRRKGYAVTIFEASDRAGGMLVSNIPAYQLPRDIIEREMKWILDHGMELKLSSPIGVPGRTITDLQQQGFKAIFLATGAQKGRPLGVEGDTVEGVLDSLAILRARGLGKTPHLGKQVVVVGGGNAAVDAARSAVRLSAEKVTILYRRTREEMPAYEEEIEEALKEKVVLHELAAPKRVLSQDGKCTGIEAIRMRLGDADDGGRRRPEPVAGSEFVIACDTVLAAIGQAPSTEAAATVAPAPGKVVPVDMATLATSVPGIYAGGDVTSGGGTVIEAIANGQRAACSIDRHLGGKGQLPPDVTFSLRRPTEEAMMASTERPREPMLAAAKRKGTFDEVVRGLTPAKACKEAGRCLRCDLEKLLD